MAPKDKSGKEREGWWEAHEFDTPSSNYEKNKNTFAYRLSESVFGSLLASYVLGFVGFVAVYVQPAKKLVINSTKDSVKIVDLLNQGMFNLNEAKNLFRIDSEETGSGISTIMQVPLYPDGIVILHYLAISTLFSFFTALLYFNYHRAIMHLSSDQKTSSIDFLLSVLIGVGFGLSMLAPLAVLFILGLLTLLSLWRKAILLRPYWLHIAEHRNLVYAGTRPDSQWDQRRARRAARKMVAEEFFKEKKDETLQSWGDYVTKPVLSVVLGAIFVPIGIYEWRARSPETFPVSPSTLQVINLVICLLAIIFLFLALLDSNRKMPAIDKEAETALDITHKEVIGRIGKKPESDIG